MLGPPNKLGVPRSYARPVGPRGSAQRAGPRSIRSSAHHPSALRAECAGPRTAIPNKPPHFWGGGLFGMGLAGPAQLRWADQLGRPRNPSGFLGLVARPFGPRSYAPSGLVKYRPSPIDLWAQLRWAQQVRAGPFLLTKWFSLGKCSKNVPKMFQIGAISLGFQSVGTHFWAKPPETHQKHKQLAPRSGAAPFCCCGFGPISSRDGGRSKRQDGAPSRASY